MEYFIVQHGKMWDSILQVLEERQRHGVQIRILYDDVGCVTTLPAMYSEQLRQKGFQVPPTTVTTAKFVSLTATSASPVASTLPMNISTKKRSTGIGRTLPFCCADRVYRV